MTELFPQEISVTGKSKKAYNSLSILDVRMNEIELGKRQEDTWLILILEKFCQGFHYSLITYW